MPVPAELPKVESADRRRPCCCGDVHLTPREVEVLCALAGGKTSKQVATTLQMSKRTVDSHVAAMLRKAGASSRGELLALGVAHGLVDMSVGAPRSTGRFCLPATRAPAAGRTV